VKNSFGYSNESISEPPLGNFLTLWNLLNYYIVIPRLKINSAVPNACLPEPLAAI
jgi:hypothetical protein